MEIAMKFTPALLNIDFQPYWWVQFYVSYSNECRVNIWVVIWFALGRLTLVPKLRYAEDETQFYFCEKK